MIGWALVEWLRGLLARPLLLVVPALSLGIVAADSPAFELFLLALSLVLLIPIALWGLITHHFALFLTLFLMLAAYCVGFASYRHNHSIPPAQNHLAHLAHGQSVDVTGIIPRAPVKGRRSWQVLIEAERCRLPGTPERLCQGLLLVYAAIDSPIWSPGDRVQATLRLRRLPRPQNPGEFDLGAYLAHHGVWSTAYIRSTKAIQTLSPDARSSFRLIFEKARFRMSQWIDGMGDNQQNEILKALTLGMPKGVPEDLKQVFQYAGTAHLLAISGLHLGIMALWLFVSVQFAWKRLPAVFHFITPLQAAAAISLPLIWGYALMAGLRIATLRAAIMVTVFLSSGLLRRHSNGINSLALAGIIILIGMPYSLFEVGFQLSFASVAAIIIGVPRLERLIPEKTRAWLWRKNRLNAICRAWVFWLAVSLVCTVVSAPILATHFHMVSWLGPLANLIVVPLYTTIIIPLLGLTTLAWLVGLPGTDLFLQVGDFLIDASITVQQSLTDTFGGVVYAATPQPAFWWLFAATLCLFIGLTPSASLPKGRLTLPNRHERKRMKISYLFASCLLAAIGSLVWLVPQLFPFPNTGIWVPHTREAAAIIVAQPDESVAFFDLATRPVSDLGDLDRRLAPLLWALGADSLDEVWQPFPSAGRQASNTFLAQRFSFPTPQYLYRQTCPFVRDVPRLCKSPTSTPGMHIWRAPVLTGKPVPLVELSTPAGRVLIVSSPHRIHPSIWHYLADTDTESIHAVVFIGPGSPTGFDSLLDAFSPTHVVLLINRSLQRYLSADTWEHMRSRFPKLHRTDRHGAAHLKYDGNLEVMPLPWYDVGLIDVLTVAQR